MVSIKDKIAKMIVLAGQLVRHCYAVKAGLLVENDNSYLAIRKKRC